MFWALARNEFLVCVRLNRAKFVLAITFVICVWYFIVVTLSHLQTSGLAPMFGVVSPRYLAALFGNSFLALFCLGVLVLAFDMQSRDENNRMHEVIASKPVSSVQFFLGRLFGIFLVMGIPLVSILMLSVVYGFISEAFAIPFGEPIELWSVVSLLVLDVLPNFIFWGLLVVLLASFIQPRFVALLFAFFSLYGLFWINSRLPLSFSTPLQTVTGSVIFPSELSPTFLTSEIIVNRVALVLMGMGLLFWLSVIYPRNTSSGASQGMKGIYAFGVGVLFIVGMYGVIFFEHQQTSGWKRVHNAHFEPASFPDVRHVEGTVDIYPGRTVSLDLNMSVSVSGHDIAEDVLFSFNPGYSIESLLIGGDSIKDYKFRSGLLKIPRRYFDDEVVSLELQAQGRPNSQFAYLDSVERISNIFGPEVRQLQYLGTENFVFRRDFVVLMPGIKWYPVSGTATNEDHWAKRPKDFFTIDLKVSVPRKWLVAGPARRQLLPEEKRTTYLFQSLNPIPRLALVASQFERASQSIEEIEFEVLYSRAHRRNFEALAPIGKKLRETVEDSLENIKATGLEYPYTVFSLVEVPAALRIYGGGSRIDTVLGMPGILMMPETTLPTLHLDTLQPVIDLEKEQQDRTSVKWMERKIPKLRRYFGIELYAGNYLSNSYRTIFSDQTNVIGPYAEMLNLIFEQVVQLSTSEVEIYFDFDLAFNRELLDLTYIEPAQILNIGKRAGDINLNKRMHDLRGARKRILATDEVLDAVVSIPSTKYNTNGVFAANLNRALRLRSLAVSRLLIDIVGTDKLNSIISTLVHRYRGQNFSYDDLIAEAELQGVNLEQLFADLLLSSRLPGFTLLNVTQTLIETDDEEESHYQVSFLITNNESVSGYCLLTLINHQIQTTNINFIQFKKPLYLENNQSLEVVVESSAPIIDIVIEPYLSLNRTELRQRVTSIPDWYEEADRYTGPPEVAIVRAVEAELFESDQFIVIDDLDAGFSIVDRSGRLNFQPQVHLARRLAGTAVKEKIRGLPAFQSDELLVPKDTWERKSDTTAYGKYWKTLILNQGGNGKTFAKFTTSLPTTGRWRLEYFLPAGNFDRVRSFLGTTSRETTSFLMGVANIDVYSGSTEITESFDTSVASRGWNLLGEYDIKNPTVEVWISNSHEYRTVFADAIRWSPAESN